jgi:hypothetical protein
MQQDKFNRLIDQLERQTKVTELNFTSSAPIIGPLVAAFRRGWNNIAARWVLRHYAGQQLEFQRTLTGLLREMQHTQAVMQQQLTEANARLISLEQTNTRNTTLHETFNRDIEMLAQHSLRQPSHPTPE